MLTKERAKALALRWLDEATLNGQPAGVELTADYTDKFNYFLYDVLTYVAAIFRLTRTFLQPAKEAEVRGQYYLISMPDDFMDLDTVKAYGEKSYYAVTSYQRESEKRILVPKSSVREEDTIEVLYFGLPTPVSVDAADSTVLEVVPKAEQLVPLRLAIEATAGSDETSAISAYLENKWSNMVVNLLGEQKGAYNVAVERVYAQ